MTRNRKGAGAALKGALICAMVGCGLWASAAQAAKLGPYFPIPNGFAIIGSPKDSLLKTQQDWLQNGLDNLKKAKKQTEAAQAKAATPENEAKLKEIDALIAQTTQELELANDTSASKEVQKERKRLFLLALNQWINELNHLATQEMKTAIMGDGLEAMTAQNRASQYSEQADNLEKAKQDITIEDWAKDR